MKKLIIVCSVLAITGCASSKITSVNPVVSVSHDSMQYESPDIGIRASVIEAFKLCSELGYSNIEPFSKGIKYCKLRSPAGCVKFQLKLNYQCLN